MNYTDHDVTKSQNTRNNIVEKAIELFAKKGFEMTTFSLLAKEAKVSRPLITRYYPKKENLFEACLHSIANRANGFIESRLVNNKGVKKHVESYIDANFEWAKECQKDLIVWMFFLSQCPFNKNYKKMNSQLRENGIKRVEEIIKYGQSSGELPKYNARSLADIIHNYLYSVVISSCTEEIKDHSKRMNNAKKTILNLLLKSKLP